jgi:hypothetical protein
MAARWLFRAVRRATLVGAIAVASLGLGGCTTTGVLLGAAGLATDTSVTWEVVKHVHGRLTEGDDPPCQRLDSVQRALNVRCGAFVPGSVRVQDLRSPRLQGCVLAVATREPRFWAALPEFIDKGASPEACARSPLVELAQANACPDFAAASPSELRALRWLAEADARAVQHDVVRMLGCPNARRVGLDAVLTTWLEQGALDPGQVGFGPLGALHPDLLATTLARALEARGHTAQAGLGGHDGQLPGGFELALRDSHWAALEWWLARVPELANRVPAAQGRQLAWAPLERALRPGFLTHPETQRDLVGFLIARGADPSRKLFYDASRSILQQARALNSPLVALLDQPPAAPPATAVADASRAVIAGPGQ